MSKFITKRNEKLLKSKLYFLANPRELRHGDVHRHVCRQCEMVFHFPRCLEWHMEEFHQGLLDQFRRDMTRSTCNKRILPHRAAAPRGLKRYKMSIDSDIAGLVNRRKIKEEQLVTDSSSDIDRLLESSDEEQEDDLHVNMCVKEVKVSVQKLNLFSKVCQVELEKLLVKTNNCDLNNNRGQSDVSDIVLVRDSGFSDPDLEIVINSAETNALSCKPHPEVVNLSVSSPSPSSQPSQWTAPEDQETSNELVGLPKLTNCKDKVTWWLATIGPGVHRLQDCDSGGVVDTRHMRWAVSGGPPR
eukprot:GFUD01074092.1.p1 GENE.GFUD01074092.1~~GFUD01074092.1.p1  ORF type:complete len:301 (-),score=76.98 GFUD01074092.1:183-1085(-)